MSAKFGCMLVSAVAAFAMPAFAVSPPVQSFSGAQNLAYQCSTVAASAETRGAATDTDLSTCSLAIRMATDEKNQLAAALTNRSVIHLVRAEYEASIADTNAALEIEANLPEALVNRGIAQMLAGRPKNAVDDLTRGLALGPEHPERVFFNRGMAREDSGDFVGAYLDYRKASELDPAWDRPKKELARFTVVQKSPTS